MATSAQALVDWSKLYPTVQNQAYIPNSSLTELNKNQTVIRDMYVDLGDVQKTFAQGSVTPSMVTIYADVVRIPSGLNWTLKTSSLTLVARRVEAAPDAKVTLDVRESKTAVLLVYAQELVAPINVHVQAATADASKTFAISELTAIGTKVSSTNGVPTQREMATLPSHMLGEGTDLHLALVSSFLFASVLLHEQPSVAIKLLDWVRTCTAQSSAFSNLFVQSSSLLVLAQAQGGEHRYVPNLNPSVYVDSVRAYVQSALAYERQYLKFTDKRADLQARIEAANLMVDNYKDKSSFSQQLIEQSQKNLNDAREAVHAAINRFRGQQREVDMAQLAFKVGMIEWKYQQEIKAMFAILQAVFEFTTAIASVVITAGASAPAAAQAGAQAVEAAVSVANSASSLSKAMERLNLIVQALEKTFALAMKLEALSKNLSLSQAAISELQQMQLERPSDEESSGVVFWKKYQVLVEAEMKQAIDLKIPGADNYKAQMQILAHYAEDLLVKQVTMMQISQELVRLNLQKQMEQAHYERLQGYVGKLGQDAEPTTEMEQLFYLRYLDQKIALFVSLENYNRSYYYWALRPSSAQPSITDKVDVLEAKLTKVQLDYQNALESFPTPPQKFQSITYGIQSAEQLQAFKDQRVVTFTIDSTAGGFSGFDRVRVRAIRIELIGAKSTSPLYLQIESTGLYHDRLKQQNYQFVSAPLERGYVYDPSTSAVLVDGVVADETEYAYFEPTPFSTWQLRLLDHNLYNQGLDLTGLTQIQIKFSGSLIIGR